MSGRPGEGTSLVDHWQGLKIRMDDRQAVHRRSWLRAPLGGPPFADKLADTCDDRWLRSRGLHRR